MKTSEQLKAEKDAIYAKIRESRSTSNGEFEKLVEQLRDIEKQEKRVKLVELVERVNREQEKLRESGAMVYKVEQPGTDITTNSGEFHATKVKKYPNIQALGSYTSAKFSDGGVMYEVRHGSKRWTLAVNRAGYNEPEKYEFFASFEEFLTHNGVLPEPITVEQMQQVIEANDKAIEKMKEAEEEFSKAKDRLKLYKLSNVGLFSQSSFGHIYEFRANI